MSKHKKHKKSKKALHVGVVRGSSIPELPKPPLCIVIREGIGYFCTNCGSTMPKSGFLMLFGKRYCDNYKCTNSKLANNYR